MSTQVESLKRQSTGPGSRNELPSEPSRAVQGHRSGPQNPERSKKSSLPVHPLKRATHQTVYDSFQKCHVHLVTSNSDAMDLGQPERGRTGDSSQWSRAQSYPTGRPCCSHLARGARILAQGARNCTRGEILTDVNVVCFPTP